MIPVMFQGRPGPEGMIGSPGPKGAPGDFRIIRIKGSQGWSCGLNGGLISCVNFGLVVNPASLKNCHNFFYLNLNFSI